MDEARKMLRAAAMELLLKLLEGTSSRVVRIFRAEAPCGVPVRLDELGANGDVPYGRFANGRGGRARGVPFVAAPASLSPGREKVTILKCNSRWSSDL